MDMRSADQKASYRVGDVSPTQQSNTTRASNHSTGRQFDIFLNVCFIVLPMLIFPGVLLGLVFAYRVQQVTPLHSNLALPGESPESGVYYVNFPATRLIFISSWSSSVAPLLVGSILTLLSYSVAPKLLISPGETGRPVLPTPYQLTLLLGMLKDSSVKTLWSWAKYRLGFGWSGKRQPQGSVLINVLVVFIIATIMGFLVFAADTWLHWTIQTSSLVLTQQLASPPQYSFQLTKNCTLGDNSEIYQLFVAPHNGDGSCTMGVSNPSQLSVVASLPLLLDASRTLQVLNNVSDVITVATNYQNNSSGISYLSPVVSALGNIDFTANTYGAQTTCTPITRKCGLTSTSETSMPYNCSQDFSGDLSDYTGGFWSLGYFTNNTLQSNGTDTGIQNPYTWALAAAVNLEGGGSLRTSSDPEIVARDGGGTAFILQCETTLYDIYYESVNNTITRFWPLQSNASVANIAQSTASLTDLLEPSLQAAASFATFSDGSQELADKIALAYSRAVMAGFSGAVDSIPAEVAQQRTEIIVSRVPAAPLFGLVASNVLFVVVALVLAIMTLRVHGREATDVQARLSNVGLVGEWLGAVQSNEPSTSVEKWFEDPDGNERPDRVNIEKLGLYGYRFQRVD